MSDKSIQVYRPVAELMAQDNVDKIERMANMIVKTAPGGQSLTKPQAVQLAVFSFMTDLNIYNRECYWLPGVGPTDGIRGNRRKAKDFVREVERGGDYYVKFRIALDHEANFDPDAGDIAWHCTLTDDKSLNEWRKIFNKYFVELREAGMDGKEAYDRAMFIAGDKPEWTGVGVVDHREKFSAAEVETWEGRKPKTYKKDENGNVIYKPEMWDKNERAQKRAEKNALGKRYPHSIIPAYQDMMFEHGDQIVAVMDKIVDRLENPPPVDEQKLLAELGYQIVESKHVPDETVVAVNGDKVVAVATVDPAIPEDVAFAMQETSSDGTPYGDLPTEKLSHMFNKMQKILKDGPEDEKQEAEYERKSQCAKLIMDYRKEMEEVEDERN